MSSTSNSSSSGSRWARIKTKTSLESPGQNLFRTVEKSRKSQTVWSQQSSKFCYKKCHILTIFPVLGKLTHIQIVYFHQEGARDTGRANKKILRAVVWRVLVSVDPENWVGLSQCGGNVDYPLVKYVQLGNHARPKTWTDYITWGIPFWRLWSFGWNGRNWSKMLIIFYLAARAIILPNILCGFLRRRSKYWGWWAGWWCSCGRVNAPASEGDSQSILKSF